MRDTGISNVFCGIMLFLPCYTFSGINLKVGPSPHEEGRYVYTVNGVKKHCLYCPKGAFYNTSENERTQEPLCLAKYGNINDEVTPFERENRKYPLCKIGEIPGCGPPPVEKKTESYTWSCDPGYSNVNYSVYFSCALISEKSRAVAWSYYCNEDLKWELDTSTPGPQVGTSMESTADDNALVPKDPLGCGPPPEEKKTEGYIWSCGPSYNNVNYSGYFSCALICEKSLAVAWSYFCNEDLQWELDLNMATDVSCRKTSVVTNSDRSVTIVIIVCLCIFGTSGFLVVVVWLSWKRKRNEITSKERVSPLGEARLAQVQTETSNVREHFHSHSTSYNRRDQMSSNDKLEIEIDPAYQQSDHALAYPQSDHAPTYPQSDFVRSELQSSLVSDGCQYRAHQQLRQSRSPSPLDAVSLLRIESLCDEGISSASEDLRDGLKLESFDDDSGREHTTPTGNVSTGTCLKTVFLGDKNDKRESCKDSGINSNLAL